QADSSSSRDRNSSMDRSSSDRFGRGRSFDRGSFDRGSFDRGSFDRGSFDRGMFGPGGFDPRGMFDRDWASGGQGGLGRTETGKSFYIAIDENRNEILVTGGADVVAKARDLVEKKIDVEQPPDPPVLIGKPFFQTYRIPAGNAKALETDLRAIFPSSPSLRITADGNYAIRVYGTPEDQENIKTKIDQNREKGLKPQIVDVGTLDATDTASKLRDMLGDATKDDNAKGAPYIVSMPEQNAVMVRGTPDQVDEVR